MLEDTRIVMVRVAHLLGIGRVGEMRRYMRNISTYMLYARQLRMNVSA